MTAHEFNALVQLLQRTPLTLAEGVWINDLLERLKPEENKTLETAKDNGKDGSSSSQRELPRKLFAALKRSLS